MTVVMTGGVWLFGRLGSGTELVTVAELLSVPAVVGMTLMVTVAVPLLASVPRAQVTLLVPLQLPCEAVAETKVTFAGSASEVVTPVAASGPLLVATRV